MAPCPSPDADPVTEWPISEEHHDSSRRTSRVAALSRLPVGSSARTTSGSLLSARTIATRWRWPPERAERRCSARSLSPTCSSSSAARRRAARGGARPGARAARRSRRQLARPSRGSLKDEADGVAAQPRQRLLSQLVTHAFWRVIGTASRLGGALWRSCRREAVGSPPRPWRRSRSSLEPSDGRLDSLPDRHLKASPHDQLPALAGDDERHRRLTRAGAPRARRHPARRPRRRDPRPLQPRPEGLLAPARRHRAGARGAGGCTPATAASSRTGTSASATARRTSSSPAARTSPRSRSRPGCAAIPPSPTSPTSPSPTASGARPSRPSSCRRPPRRSPPPS
jgi:hypothetical protein